MQICIARVRRGGRLSLYERKKFVHSLVKKNRRKFRQRIDWLGRSLGHNINTVWILYFIMHVDVELLASYRHYGINFEIWKKHFSVYHFFQDEKVVAVWLWAQRVADLIESESGYPFINVEKNHYKSIPDHDRVERWHQWLPHFLWCNISNPSTLYEYLYLLRHENYEKTSY